MFYQVQIFTRDGAFVRKFGATVLQHPRGVTVDFRGRIVVVECKVSPTIFFISWIMTIIIYYCIDFQLAGNTRPRDEFSE